MRALELKALVLVLSVCSYGPAVAPKALSPVLVGLDNMLRVCSFNKTGLAGGTKVLQSYVPIPCSGQTHLGQSFVSSSCEFGAWGDYALHYAERSLGVPVWEYKHRIFIVPKGDVCPWGGMGYVGCTNDCRVWVSGDLWNMPMVYIHELGHNMGLEHAGMLGDNGYGDFSSAMGFCCNSRCHGAPHSNVLGWSQPLAILDTTSLRAGRWLTFTVPAAVHDKKNHIVITPDWKDRNAHKLYVSYRKRRGVDIGLQAGFADAVILHSMPFGSNTSSFETSLQANQMVEDARLGTGVTLFVSQTNDTHATVSVCRRTRVANCTV